MKVNKTDLDKLSTFTNRTINQTNLLLSLLNDDLEELLKLEFLIKKNHVYYCPGDLEELDKLRKRFPWTEETERQYKESHYSKYEH